MLSLKTKILLLYAVVGTCLALLIGTLLSSRLKEDRFAAIYSDFQHRLNHVDFSLTSFFQGVEADLRALTLNEFVRSRDDDPFTSFLQADPETFEYRIGELEQRIIDLFHHYRTTHRYVNSVYMGRENGSFVRSHKRAKPTQYDPRERPWYTLAKANPGSVARTAPYSSVTSPDINVGVVTALLDERSGVYGVVGMDVTLSDLTTFIENVRAGRSGYMILMDENGVILASRDKQSLFKNVYDVYQGDLGPLFQKHLGYTSVTRDGIREYLFFQTSLGLNWRLGILMPAAEIEEEIDAFVNKILLALLLSLALLSALTLGGLQKFVIRPLKTLSDGADFIARTGELDHPIDIRSGDEIGNLGRSFKRMIETVANTEASLKASEAELTKHRDHLEDLVDERTEELMKAQDQLRETEERSRLILESAGEGIIGVDANGRITFVNPAALRVLGYEKEDFVGQGLHDLVHHSLGDGTPYPIEDCPMYQSYAYGDVHRVDNEVLWRKGGTSFPVEYSSTPVTKEGAVVGAVITFRDTTERMKMDAELKEYVADLERFNRLVVGREERMIQLKEEINGLMEKLGQEKRYRVVQ